MSKKLFILFLGSLFWAPFEGKALDYKCYDPAGTYLGIAPGKGNANVADVCNAKYGDHRCPPVPAGSTIKGCTDKPLAVPLKK